MFNSSIEHTIVSTEKKNHLSSTSEMNISSSKSILKTRNNHLPSISSPKSSNKILGTNKTQGSSASKLSKLSNQQLF